MKRTTKFVLRSHSSLTTFQLTRGMSASIVSDPIGDQRGIDAALLWKSERIRQDGMLTIHCAWKPNVRHGKVWT